jgi:hypothetical protein
MCFIYGPVLRYFCSTKCGEEMIHGNKLKHILDIYDTSGIRALLTKACEICTRRSRVV